MTIDPNRSNSEAPAVPGIAAHEVLPPGTRFGEFEILGVLGHGGFGIVYLAHDHSLERQVALKEYMPAALATRGIGAAVTLRSSRFAQTYAMGLRSFVNEARLLARFDHPSLLKVHRFWEDNATAYTVMPYLQGPTLRAARLASAGRPPDDAWLRGVLDALLDAIAVMHGEGVFHRDIAPDNIVLLPSGVPVLLDFGAARRDIAERAHPHTAILKPSYAPIEQYAEMASTRQGPWTDLYALGAVMHFLLFGEAPAPATVRAIEGDAVALADRPLPPGVSRAFAGAVGWMLEVHPAHRPQSVAALREVLSGAVALPSRPGPVAEPHMPRPLRTQAGSSAGCTTVPMVAPAVRSEGEDQDDGEGPEQHDTTDAPGAHGAHGAPGSHGAPLRSMPPGTLPPVYVPAKRAAPSVVSQPVRADALAPKAPSVRRRIAAVVGVALIGSVAALAVSWQATTAPTAAATAGSAAGARSEAGVGVALRAPRAAVAVADAAAARVVPRPLLAEVKAASPSNAPIAAQRAATAPGPVPAMLAQSTAALHTEAIGVATLRSSPAKPRASRAAARAPSKGHARTALAARAQPAPAFATAREACAGRHFLSAAVCMDRECERPQFSRSTECVRVLVVKRDRLERRAAL